MNKELKDRFRKAEEIVWKGNARMIDYCCKTTDVVFPVRSYIAGIDRPNIKTRFCFGYGYCGITTEEDEQNANEMAYHASTNENYFIRENLKELDRRIEKLLDNGIVAYASGCYHETNDLVGINFCWLCDVDMYRNDIQKDGGVFFELTESERKEIAGYYNIAKEHFTKRLKAYLKRYGLSKVESWTYLSD